MSSRHAIRRGDCRQVLTEIPDGSVDAMITDPPYPEVDRDYGRFSESEWFDLMTGVVEESRRILKPSGSAVFLLQPNSKHVGQMRLWPWRFALWLGEAWNIVQDHYWWNFATVPTVHCQRRYGLARPSVKWALWAGAPDCYRNQDEVLWTESDAQAANNRSQRALKYPSGHHLDIGRIAQTSKRRGGVTPFNLLPLANTNSVSGAGAKGHGAGTPLEWCRWWVRYIVPPRGVVVDPFCGSGTMLVACDEEDRHCIGIEDYHFEKMRDTYESFS